jgi:hypothetical protein
VAQGFSQVPGVDYTYAPVVKPQSTRLLMHLAAVFNLEIHLIDITRVYLNSMLNESIYMMQPPGYAQEPSKVCLLNKTLYGLKWSGHEWHKLLTTFLTSKGFRHNEMDWGIYSKSDGDKMVIITFYVDDTTLYSNCKSTLSQVKNDILSTFNGKDTGEKNWYIPWNEGHQDTKPVKNVLSQTAYVENLLKSTLDAQTVPTAIPMHPNNLRSITNK